MAEMSQERRNEIGFRLLKHRMAEKGITLGGSGKRELGNEASAAGIPLSELQAFAIDMLPELIERTLGVKNVRITFEATAS